MLSKYNSQNKYIPRKEIINSLTKIKSSRTLPYLRTKHILKSKYSKSKKDP